MSRILSVEPLLFLLCVIAWGLDPPGNAAHQSGTQHVFGSTLRKRKLIADPEPQDDALCEIILDNPEDLDVIKEEFGIHDITEVVPGDYMFPCFQIDSYAPAPIPRDVEPGSVRAREIESRNRIDLVSEIHNHPLVKRLRQTSPMAKLKPADSYSNSYLWHLDTTKWTHYGNKVKAGNDVNIVPAWEKATGKGVTILIVDDGLYVQHNDFQGRVDLDLSIDFLTSENSPGNPTPKSSSDTHGTSVAGVAAASRFNDICAIGPAYEATLAGRNLLASGGQVSRTWYTKSLDCDDCDVINNSWCEATCDDTSNYCSPGASQSGSDLVERRSLTPGAPIYLWAAGNEAEYGADANIRSFCRMYETICIGAIEASGEVAPYSTPGTCVDASAPSNGYGVGFEAIGITAPSYPGVDSCTDDFGGTSSATPLVSGIVALLKQLNKQITVRDVRHLFSIYTELPNYLESSWIRNRALFDHSRNFGFGRPDAALLTEVMASYTLLPQSRSGSMAFNGWYDPDDGLLSRSSVTMGTKRKTVSAKFSFEPSGAAAVGRTEAVIANWDIRWSATVDNYGQMTVTIISPHGTRSKIMVPHKDTSSRSQSITYDIDQLSLQFYGEPPVGTWEIEFALNPSWNPRTTEAVTLSNPTLDVKGIHQTVILHPLIEDENYDNSAIPQFSSVCEGMTLHWTWSDSEDGIITNDKPLSFYLLTTQLSQAETHIIRQRTIDRKLEPLGEDVITGASGSVRLPIPTELIGSYLLQIAVISDPSITELTNNMLLQPNPYISISTVFGIGGTSGYCEVVYENQIVKKDLTSQEITSLTDTKNSCLIIDARDNAIFSPRTRFDENLGTPIIANFSASVKPEECKCNSEIISNAADQLSQEAIVKFGCSQSVLIKCTCEDGAIDDYITQIKQTAGPGSPIKRLVILGEGTTISGRWLEANMEFVGLYGNFKQAYLTDIRADSVEVFLSGSNPSIVRVDSGIGTNLTVKSEHDIAHTITVSNCAYSFTNIAAPFSMINLEILPFPYPFGYLGLIDADNVVCSDRDAVCSQYYDAKNAKIKNAEMEESGNREFIVDGDQVKLTFPSAPSNTRDNA